MTSSDPADADVAAERPSARPAEPTSSAEPADASWAERVRARLKTNLWYRRATVFYHRHQRIAPVVFFFGGVTLDLLTLNRIDAWEDNLLLLVYIIASGVLIMLAALLDCDVIDTPRLHKYEDWFPAATQFFFGALFSAYVIFYSQSASLTKTSAFLVLLVLLLVANEIVHRRLFNLYLLFALYYFLAASFFIFFIPVVISEVDYGTFLAGTLVSLGLVVGMVTYLWLRGIFPKFRQYALALGIVATIFGLLNGFYQLNWIPPVPLAMRHAGVFHEVVKTTDDDGMPVYRLRYEQPEWYAFWERSDDVFHYVPGQRVYCFTAVFAPTDLEKQIFHEWQFRDETEQTWVTTDRIGYEITGGREFGYRGFTVKRNVRPGRWRVNVQTADGRMLGRIRFSIVEGTVSDGELAERLYR